MMRLPWLTDLDEDLQTVFRNAGAPLLEKQAFAGDAWVWSGREYLEQPTDEDSGCAAEVQFRARPDQLHDGPQVELLAAAWGVKKRRVSWSRTCWARYVDPSELHNDGLLKELTEVLLQAWVDAQMAGKNLTSLPDPRDQAIQMLNEKGVSVRMRGDLPAHEEVHGVAVVHS
jgi:hypothetical protein